MFYWNIFVECSSNLFKILIQVSGGLDNIQVTFP